MTQISTYEFRADEGKVFVHKETKQRYGNGIYLGVIDNIDNYNEEDATDADFQDPEDPEELNIE